MTKKTKYIITFVFLGLVLAGLVGYYILSRDTGGEEGTITNVFRNFFPFGGNETNPESNYPTPEYNTPSGNEESVNFIRKLRKLTSEPVAGAGLLDVKAGTVVRYIEKATGHIYEIELFSPRQGRISNTTMPRVYDALWGNKNSSLITRYLKDDDRTVETFSLTVKEVSTTTENTISGIAFPENITDVSIFGSSVFYLEKDDSSSYGYISTFSGTSRKQIWSSPMKEILSQYVNAKTVALTTKPEENTPGFLYFVDTGNGTVRKIIGDILGLSTLVNTDATKVLYLNQGGNATMYLYDLVSKSSTTLTPPTFPEKCVWDTKDKNIVYCAVPEEYLGTGSLTNWYKGIISTNDDIWKYDLKNNTATIVANLQQESGEYIDVIKPILSENEQHLVFVNKKDNTLWSLDLTK